MFADRDRFIVPVRHSCNPLILKGFGVHAANRAGLRYIGRAPKRSIFSAPHLSVRHVCASVPGLHALLEKEAKGAFGPDDKTAKQLLA